MIEVTNFLGIIALPIIFFVWSNYRNNLKSTEEKITNLNEKVDDLKLLIASNPESFRRVHERIENLEQNHNRLESAVEVRLDKFSDKLEKIYDILVERASGG